jgi:hypothetical protein
LYEQAAGRGLPALPFPTLESWLKTKSAPILGRQFEPLQLV